MIDKRVCYWEKAGRHCLSQLRLPRQAWMVLVLCYSS